MTKRRILLSLLIVVVLGCATWFAASTDLMGKIFNEDDPDRSPTGVEIPRDEYLRLRIEQMDLLQGYDTAQQQSRTNSILEMERSERELQRHRREANLPEDASWVPLGPSPIPNGNQPYSGRVSAIAVHPTDPNIAYVGTAQGGLYRTLNGGATWTPLMDNALTLAIGAVAISPSDPTTIFVGTGESTLCSSGCFIGVGLYRITNADTTPVLSDALNKNAANADVFTGRAISEVLVHPTDPNTVFVATSSGVAGIGGSTTGATLPALGLYRTTNAMSASPTFTKLSIAGIADRSITDLAMEPDNPNRIYVGALGLNSGDGGIYATSNALDTAPTFTQALSTSATGGGSRIELAAAKVNGINFVYAASGQGNGTIFSSPDSGPFTQVSSTGFCSTQCFYDIAIAVDPTNASKVYLGGSPSLVFGRSTNSGASFASSSSGLHVDTQAIAVAPSNPNIVYFGSDGGIWRTTNVSATPIVWTSLNNSTISATQFTSLAIHPLDRNYSLGGTQDNGTEFLAPDGAQWIRSDGGDGGFSVIDQGAPDTDNVVAYHTYYNQTSTQIGFARALTTTPPGDPNWTDFLGCGNGAQPNGISCSDPVLFYAPMVGGPSIDAVDTLYFGTNKLYRSTDQGTTMVSVGSAGLSARISAIAIAPQDDNVRLIGTSAGAVMLQTTPGATTLTTVTGAIGSSARYVGRTAIDPLDANKAYVCLNGFGLTGGKHVWKTTNLLSGTPTWVVAGNGIPDTPVNSFAIDPMNTDTLYAGTDIGVFKSTDGGANWIPFSNGLPRVAVFGMAIQNSNRVLRIATHGRGMWDYDLSDSTPNSVAGTVTYGNAAAPPKFVSNALVTGTGSSNVTTTTGLIGPTAGQYTLTGFGSGNYMVSVSKGVGVGANGISSLDAARIAQHVAGVAPFTTDIQRVTADVSNNGTLSSTDAAQLARYVAQAGPPYGSTGTWRFFLPPGPTFPVGSSPTSYSYSPPIGTITGQDFVAVLGGEVTGNWTPTDTRPARGPERSAAVRCPRLSMPTGGEIVIPVSAQGTANKAIISYQFDLRFDPSVIQPQPEAADVAGTASRGLSIIANVIEPGLMRVVAYGAYPIDASRLLINLKFRAVGTPRSASPLILENFMFNEGDPGVATINGQIELSSAGSAE